MMGTIRTAQHAANWTPSRQREDACQGCEHADPRPVGNITTWYCTRHGFNTHALAICDQIAFQTKEARHG